jgi:DNA uptake protein ComE-like DNA-binding protein
MKTKLLAIPMIAAGLASIALSGCGPSTTSDSGTATTAASASANAPSPGQKVSANTASETEIAAALQAAGVANAQRWAREVVEYRPYDTGDANLTKLQQNLAKYNPGQDTVNKIVGALRP